MDSYNFKLYHAFHEPEWVPGWPKMAGATTDNGMVLHALRSTLRSLFEAKRYTYEHASTKTGLVPSRLHTLAQGSIPVRIDNLPELLIALERLDPELLNRELWFDRFVEEDRLRLNTERPRISETEPEHSDEKEMAALIGKLDGQNFSGQAAVVGANRIHVRLLEGAFSKTKIIHRPIHIDSLKIIIAAGSVSSDSDWARLERDLAPFWRGSFTAEQMAYLQECSYELPQLPKISRSLSERERLVIASRPERNGLELIKATADWECLETTLERTIMKEMTEKNLPMTFEHVGALCGNAASAIDIILILQYNTAKKELHISYVSPVALCHHSRRPDRKIDFDGLLKRATPLMEDLITPNAAGEPEFFTLHDMRVALMQLHQADLGHGLIEVVAYINVKGDRRDDTEENAVRYNPEISEAYRMDKGLEPAEASSRK